VRLVSDRRVQSTGCRAAAAVCICIAATAFGQKAPENVDPVKIIKPTVDKAAGTVTIPAAFWNERLADWVETGLCGRPSDFLHETVVCVTTTRAEMERALREAGFHDASAWVFSVRDFPRVRGDRILVTLKFTLDGKPAEYSLDELLAYSGWGVSAGPYGFMFKGDPGAEISAATAPAVAPASAPATQGAGDEEPDRLKILKDDPQMALIFKGIQSMSQSFADHPLAYDDWILPMMNFERNYAVLPAKVFNSNGDVPVTLTLRKVNEEEFVRESARLWHEAGGRENILAQIETAKAVDRAKGELWALVPDVKKLLAVPQEKRDVEKEDAVFGRAAVLAAEIEYGYARMDHAWGAWAAGHQKLAEMDDRSMRELRAEAEAWAQHLEKVEESAKYQLAAEQAAFEQKRLSHLPAGPDSARQMEQARGREIIARSRALLADNAQSLAYWNGEKARLQENDPRTAWVKKVGLMVELAKARQEAAALGEKYGAGLESGAADASALGTSYGQALARIRLGELRLNLVMVEFEIEKRESLVDVGADPDPELPSLRDQKKHLEEDIHNLVEEMAGKGAATAPK
jgi:hypothetical protein